MIKKVKRKKSKCYLNVRKQIYQYDRVGLKKEKDQQGQDTTDVISVELGPNTKYFAVYDGHGIKGSEASQLARDEVRMSLLNDKKIISKMKDRKEVEKYFKKLFNNIQAKYKKRTSDYELSGTCVIAVLLVENHCFVINLGDSRAVIGSKQGGQKIAFQMSIDHKANREEEKKRIEESGGIVVSDKYGA